jgi:hypothetical protein
MEYWTKPIARLDPTFVNERLLRAISRHREFGERPLCLRWSLKDIIEGSLR